MSSSHPDALQIAATLVRLRRRAGLSQTELAARAATSQPAIARYESGAAVPSWTTLARLLRALGHELRLAVDPVVDPHDLELAEELLDVDPEDRLRSLARVAALAGRVEEVA